MLVSNVWYLTDFRVTFVTDVATCVAVCLAFLIHMRQWFTCLGWNEAAQKAKGSCKRKADDAPPEKNIE